MRAARTPKARHAVLFVVSFWLPTLAATFFSPARDVFGNEPVALRIESFAVAPSSQPLARVVIKSLLDTACEGTVSLDVPDGWRIAPEAQPFSLGPGETAWVVFDVERGVSLEANSYPLAVSATVGGVVVTRKQDVVAASAPYFKPTIDGDPSDWEDAIPVTFSTGGCRTVIRTFWNSRQSSRRKGP